MHPAITFLVLRVMPRGRRLRYVPPQPPFLAQEEIAMNDVSPLRLNLLRINYLAMAGVLGSWIWPLLLDPAKSWPLASGIVASILGALAVVAVLGLLHPLRMLPVLIFELGWKTIWLVRVALPAWLQGPMDPETLRTFYQCIGVVVLLFLIPWGHVWRTYIAARSEPWLRAS